MENRDEYSETLVMGIICFLLISLFVILVAQGVRDSNNHYKGFINQCSNSNFTKIVDNTKIRHKQVLRRKIFYLVNKYEIVDEEIKDKDIKLYFNDNLFYDLKEYPSEYIKGNKIIDCNSFYNDYVKYSD